MEAVIVFIFVTIWWVLSLSVLLPALLLLYFNKPIRDKWFSIFFVHIISPIFGPIMRPHRVRLFNLLKKSLDEDKKTHNIKILEIGIGGGANLAFYPENCNLTALDMNASFEKFFCENKKKYPNINYERTIINMAENMCDVENNSFDVVVSTYVLCSVKSLESVVKEVKRVLKPGGKYLLLEHVAFPKSNIKFFVQKYATPLWKIYFDGCCLDRNIEDVVNKAGFEDVHCERIFNPKIPLFFRPQITVIATK